jgi:DNA polymerase-3 subunit chi
VTRIDFHVGATDKLGYAARLVRKACGSGVKVTVTAPQELLERFDVKLWTFSQLDFTPHVFVDSPLAAQTPVLLASDPKQSPWHEVLINLGERVPDGFAAFERLIELVGGEEAEKAAGRERYRHYRDRGYALSTHEIDAGAA